MASIRLTDAAHHYRELSHQIAAWNWLQEQLTAQELEEFAELYRADPPPKPSAPPSWLAPARRIIREFEGCRLEAYRDATGVPTLGWGSTRLNGRAVRLGDRVTQEEADELLDHELLTLFGPGVLHLIPAARGWNSDRVAALVSFAYNVGLGALEESTLRKRLLAGEDPIAVVREELPRWCHAGEAVLAGLQRRREAEVALFVGSAPKPTPRFTPTSSFALRVTPHITYGELTLQQEQRRFNSQYQCETAQELCRFIEKAREAFGGKPAIITSAYRPPAINRSVGGASNSEHLYDAPGVGAIDFFLDGVSVLELQKWVDREWPYSVGYGAPLGFVHLGKRRGAPRVRWDY